MNEGSLKDIESYEGLLFHTLNRVLKEPLGSPERYMRMMDLDAILSPSRGPDHVAPTYDRSSVSGQHRFLVSLIAEMAKAGYMGRGRWRE